MRRFHSLVFQAALGGLVLALPTRVTGQAISGAGCFGETETTAHSVLGKVRKTVSDPRLAVVRDRMGLVPVPSDSVVLETNPGTCNKARKLIDEYRNAGIAQRKLVLVRVGSLYWAEDPALRGGEFTDVYLLDKELTRVIKRH